jgi:hypothetical protein
MPAAVIAADAATSAAADKPPAAQMPLRCEPPTLGRDKLTVACAIESSKARRIRVTVHLTGSHDDTTASMEVALGDAPVACDAGSKTSTQGEDGDVTLDCRFTAPGGPGAATVLRASAKWFHAQYVGLEVDGRRPWRVAIEPGVPPR